LHDCDKFLNHNDLLTLVKHSLFTGDTFSAEKFLKKLLVKGYQVESALTKDSISNLVSNFYNVCINKSEEFLLLKKEFVQSIDSGYVNLINTAFVADQMARKDTLHSKALLVDDSIRSQKIINLIKNDRLFMMKVTNQDQLKFIVMMMHSSLLEIDSNNFLYNYLIENASNGTFFDYHLLTLALEKKATVKMDCSLYGITANKNKALCDCLNIDKIRKEIGLPPLKYYLRKSKKTAPDCYFTDNSDIK
jgi:hypothetical protein